MDFNSPGIRSRIQFMIFSARLIILTLFLFDFKLSYCKKLDSSKHELFRTQIDLLNTGSDAFKPSNKLLKPIIKTSKNRKSPAKDKRVKFADQILDDSIGNEPLDSNLSRKMSYKNESRTGSNSASNLTKNTPLILWLILFVLPVTLFKFI